MNKITAINIAKVVFEITRLEIINVSENTGPAKQKIGGKLGS